jgi:hypothetical protein
MQVLVVLLVGEGGKGAGDMATYFAAHWVEVEVEVGARDKTEEVDLVVQVEDFQLRGLARLEGKFQDFSRTLLAIGALKDLVKQTYNRQQQCHWSN